MAFLALQLENKRPSVFVMKLSDSNVCQAFDCKTITDVARKIRNQVDIYGYDEYEYAFNRLTNTRGVGKTWLHDFLFAFGFSKQFSLYEKKRLPSYKWVFSSRKDNSEVRAKIRAINAQIRALQEEKKKLSQSI